MTYIQAYLAVSVGILVLAYFRNRHRIKCAEDACTIVGMSILWPITLGLELWQMWREYRYIRHSRRTYDEIKEAIRQNRREQ